MYKNSLCRKFRKIYIITFTCRSKAKTKKKKKKSQSNPIHKRKNFLRIYKDFEKKKKKTYRLLPLGTVTGTAFLEKIFTKRRTTKSRTTTPEAIHTQVSIVLPSTVLESNSFGSIQSPSLAKVTSARPSVIPLRVTSKSVTLSLAKGTKLKEYTSPGVAAAYCTLPSISQASEDSILTGVSSNSAAPLIKDFLTIGPGALEEPPPPPEEPPLTPPPATVKVFSKVTEFPAKSSEVHLTV